MKGTPQQASDYCKKEGNFVERGILPDDKYLKCGMKEKARWALARKASEEGRFDDIPDDIYMRNYGSIHHIYQDSMPTPPIMDGLLENEWIWGDTGVGKSAYAHAEYPDLYPKPRNKWWDGYKQQDVILLEELAPTDADWIAPLLKIWADRYPFIAEMKGRSVMIRPKKIIVCCNFSPD